MTRKPPLAISILLALAVVAAVSCGSDDSGGGSTSGSDDDGGSSGGAASSVTVSAQDFTFSPDPVEVPAGATVTVTFENDDDVPHTMTSDDLGLDIKADGGASTEGTFTAPDSGSVEFHCEIHPQMTGQITVAGADAGAGSDDSEDADSDDSSSDDSGDDSGYDY